MPMFRFLLFDTGVILQAHKVRVWESLTRKCRVTVARSVADEALYWEDEDGRHPIDLNASIKKGEIYCVEMSLSQVNSLREKFDATYLERMDPGETESIAFLVSSDERWLLASGDAFAYRILGQMGLGDRGISLEEILERVGLGRRVEYAHTKEFREKSTLRGQQENIMGRGLKKGPLD